MVNLILISKEILPSIVKSLKNHYTSNMQKVISVLKRHFFPYKLACPSIQELTKHTQTNSIFFLYYKIVLLYTLLCFKGTYIYEPHHEKKHFFLPMRKQRRRSAVQLQSAFQYLHS